MVASGVSLTTFRRVPFNAPFYARLGFGEVDPATTDPLLADAFRREVPEGIDPAERVAMLLELGG